MSEPSVFTRILNGDIPGEVVYQDATSFVIVTLEPITPGHVLVIPKAEVDSLWDVEDVTYRHLMDVAKKMVKVIDAAYSYKRVGLAVEGFGVPHTHIHVFGLNEGLEPSLVHQAATKHHISAEELKETADKLRACL